MHLQFDDCKNVISINTSRLKIHKNDM
uniref:Uncharacterized protein n=1 Tax=Arundo donax TaxID=35708 RepID=A0A0A9A1X5_ARUDO